MEIIIWSFDVNVMIDQSMHQGSNDGVPCIGHFEVHPPKIASRRTKTHHQRSLHMSIPSIPRCLYCVYIHMILSDSPLWTRSIMLCGGETDTQTRERGNPTTTLLCRVGRGGVRTEIRCIAHTTTINSKVATTRGVRFTSVSSGNLSSRFRLLISILS